MLCDVGKKLAIKPHPATKKNAFIIQSLIDNNIKIVEMDSRDNRNIINLIKLDVEKMAYSQKDEKLYLIKDNELLAISLE